MIKQLRRRFVLVMSASSFTLITFIIISINLLNLTAMDIRTTRFLQYISENDYAFMNSDGEYSALDYMNPLTSPLYYNKTSYFESFYYVEMSDDGTANAVYTKNVVNVDDETALRYAEKILQSGDMLGYGEEMYKFMVTPVTNGHRICFLDINKEMTHIGSMVSVSVCIALFFFIIMCIIGIFVSKKIIRPVELNSRRQKQFITDAGHELKTPLAIISANTEVLEMTNGENEWTSSIKKQTSRMADLVNQMLVLAKFEEKSDKNTFKNFCLSETVENTAKSFDVIAEKNGKKLRISIWPMINITGDEIAVTELITILIDNAVKYSPDDSTIDIRLTKKSKNIIFETENLLKEKSAVDTKRIFDRFYRADRSRSRKTGGYGIGLSIAKAIAENHKGDITSLIDNEKIKFTVTLPLNKKG